MAEKKTEKFPEEETADGGRFGDYDVYDRVEVDDWFGRCLADMPKLTYYDSKDLVKYYRGEAMAEWITKWFSQFKKEEAEADDEE